MFECYMKFKLQFIIDLKIYNIRLNGSLPRIPMLMSTALVLNNIIYKTGVNSIYDGNEGT
jgi:hypothetical protein